MSHAICRVLIIKHISNNFTWHVNVHNFPYLIFISGVSIFICCDKNYSQYAILYNLIFIVMYFPSYFDLIRWASCWEKICEPNTFELYIFYFLFKLTLFTVIAQATQVMVINSWNAINCVVTSRLKRVKKY